MQAAYYMSKFSREMLMPYEHQLISMLPTVNGYGGHVALALSKTLSQAGKQAIVNELGDGSRNDAWLFRKALGSYDEGT